MPFNNLLTSDFDFALPTDRIAAQPISPRDRAKLLRVRQDDLDDLHVYDLPDLLRRGDLLVLNDTKVIPARLFGKLGERKFEIFLHKKETQNTWYAFANPARHLSEGDEIAFAPGFACRVKEKRQHGEILVIFDSGESVLNQNLKKHGFVPLPPYIRRDAGPNEADKANYQTVYAEKEGAVAAPTAGLHFTPELLAKLDSKGIERVTLTLHVGAGTFLPVKTEHVRDHVMHAEWGEITPEAAEKINATRKKGRRIVAVGTTSLRLLESAADENGTIRPFTGETSIFITPGYRFKAVDVLMTNFHLPKSTLFMLVAAFSGLERMKSAYEHAISHDYRFYSYGDCTLLEKAP